MRTAPETTGRSGRRILAVLVLVAAPHLLLCGGLLALGASGYEGVCRVHRPEPEPCSLSAYLLGDIVLNPFLFTLGAMGSGAWCSLLALLALLIGLTRWARARR